MVRSGYFVCAKQVLHVVRPGPTGVQREEERYCKAGLFCLLEGLILILAMALPGSWLGAVIATPQRNSKTSAWSWVCSRIRSASMSASALLVGSERLMIRKPWSVAMAWAGIDSFNSLARARAAA